MKSFATICILLTKDLRNINEMTKHVSSVEKTEEPMVGRGPFASTQLGDVG
jgi:hypothetical protein